MARQAAAEAAALQECLDDANRRLADAEASVQASASDADITAAAHARHADDLRADAAAAAKVSCAEISSQLCKTALETQSAYRKAIFGILSHN